MIEARVLLGDDADAFEDALVGPPPGPIAVVSDPFAGRGTVLDLAENRLAADRITLEPGATAADVVDALDAATSGDHLVIEDCHHLYTRRIGGFEELDAFLDALSTTEAFAVTGWNRYAWTYLEAIRDVDRVHDRTFHLDSLDAEMLERVVRSEIESELSFAPIEYEPPAWFEMDSRDLTVLDFEFSVPIPRIESGRLFVDEADDQPDPQEAVFERLADLSNGNPGVALAIWPDEETEVHPDDLVIPAPAGDVNDEEAYCLHLLLAKERMARGELADIIGSPFERVRGHIHRLGLAQSDDDTITLDPSGLTTAVKASERRRFL